MADYTAAEIQDAVEKVVRSAIRRPYGSLGNRDIQTTFDDLQDAAAGVFILNANSPFYVVFLGTERLTGLLASIEADLVSLIEAIENTDRRVPDVDNLAPLANARAALDALSGALGGRTQSFTSIDDVPAYQRYELNTQRFLDEASKNIRKGGAIVPTPQESRALLAPLVSSIQESHADILDRATFLSVAIDDYDTLQLPSLLAQGVISRARDVLQDRIDELEALSPKARNSAIRDVTLDILTGRAAVRGLGSLRQTTTFALLEGDGVVFADAEHSATPASITSEFFGPYPIIPGEDQLPFTMEGSFLFTVLAPSAFVAFIEARLPGPYDIDATNDSLLIDVDGFAQVVVSLTNGLGRTADDIVADINAAIGAQPIVAETALQNLKFEGVVDLVVPSGFGGDMDFVLPSGDWDTLLAQLGHIVEVDDPTSVNDGARYVVTAINGDTLTGTQLLGPAPTAELLIVIRMGVGLIPRVRIEDGAEVAALDARRAISLPALVGNTALQVLGLTAGAVVRSRSVSAPTVATGMNASGAAQSGGSARLTADSEFVAGVWSGQGRTDPDDPTKLVAYRFRGRGSTAGGGPAGVVFAVEGAATAGVVVGDVGVVRETSVFADQGAFGSVVGVTDSTVTVDLDRGISGVGDLLLEVGPNLVLVSAYADLVVSDSASQDGDYTMDYFGQGVDLPFEFVIEGSVPLNRGQNGLPVFFTLEIGLRRTIFRSTDTTLATSIELDGTGNPFEGVSKFFSGPESAVGSTSWFQIPEDPKTLSVGDQLELYEVLPGTPSRVFEVVALELSNLLLQLGEELETDFGTINMSLSSQVPFGRIRLVKKNNYSVLEEDLVQWLTLPQNQEAYFRELNRLLNPIIANENPSIAAVNAAKNHVRQLLGILTINGATTVGAPTEDTLEAILAAYQVRPEQQVDTLVDTFLARGSDRGIDVLLQGRFSEFFGLTPESMSYDGHFRETLKSVQMDDLPVRKVERTRRLDNSLTEAEFEEPDFDFDQSDTQDIDEADIPAEFSDIIPPGR